MEREKEKREGKKEKGKWKRKRGKLILKKIVDSNSIRGKRKLCLILSLGKFI
tara:strand:- start:193 stop:348 length:156 start_codon:yes stop_codon:yes gene_type:complete